MNITPETPRNEVTMAGAVFLVPAPFVPGHVCTDGEASALNQVLAENVRNNLVGRAKREPEEGEAPFIITQEAVDEYVADYEFGVRRGGTREAALPPEEREARKIASEKVRAALQKAGIKISTVDKDKMDQLVLQAIEKYPEIKKEAERRVKNAAKIGMEELDLSAISTPAGDEAARAAA